MQASEPRTVLIDTEVGFQGIREVWNKLVDACARQSVFLTHEWFDAAWQWAKEDSELWILCVYEADRLIGICPSMRRRRAVAGIHMKELSLLTIPDSQFCDVIAPQAKATVVCDAIAGFLLESRQEWDVLRFDCLWGEQSYSNRLGGRLEKYGLTTRLLAGGVNRWVKVAGSWENYYGRRSRRLKKGNNLIANRLRRATNQIGVELLSSDTSPLSADDVVALVSAISAGSWKQKTGTTFDTSGASAFLRRLVANTWKKRWMRVGALILDGSYVAYELQLIYGGEIHALRADFDPEFEEVSPGSYLNWKLLEALFHGQPANYFLGRGDNAYKLRWAEEECKISRLDAYAATPKGYFAQHVDIHLRRVLKKIKGIAVSRKVGKGRIR